MNAVEIVQMSETVAEIRWASNTSNDMVADSSLALLLGIDSSPATVKRKFYPRHCVTAYLTLHSHCQPTSTLTLP